MKTVIQHPVIGFVLFLQLWLIPAASEATTRFVKAGASGTGTSWSNPSGDLQAMITASASASGDEVWVAKGTYLAASAPSQTFKLKPSVSVKGGYNAGFDGDNLN